LVPLAMALRPQSSKESVRTEPGVVASTEVVSPGGAPVVEPPPSVVASSVDPATSIESSDVATAAPATSPPSTAADQAQPDSSGQGATETAGAAAVPQGFQAPEAAPQSDEEVADVEEPAERVAPVCHLTYEVAAGDYWIGLADAAGTTLAKLLQANLATIHTPIFPGDDICLPDGATLPAPPTTTTSAPPSTTTPATTPPTTDPPSTTAAPTTAPSTTAPPPPGEVEAIIREVWPDDLEERALEIAWRESGYRTNAKNWCCYGLFQIYWNVHKSWLDDLGVTAPTQLFDARTNASAAFALYQRSGGWGPWDG
ncbi:MAG: LysM peptidoglycan-binding domain-containing protein, partial [Ilumatobacteraceae bacterium]